MKTLLKKTLMRVENIFLRVALTRDKKSRPTLKNPKTTTLLLSWNDLTSSTTVNSLAAGPVFLFNQLIILGASRPPEKKLRYHWYSLQGG